MREVSAVSVVVTLQQRLASQLRRARAGVALPLSERFALGGALLLATVMNLFRLAQSGYGNLYYAATVRSMLESWHNFFFVSFDPGGFVTADKPPVDLWLQALSAKLFGFNGLSLMLPQALAGIAAVGVLYLLVRRVFGMLPATLAALALALTPISVAAARANIVDSLLVLVVLIAAWAVLRAVETGDLRWLLFSAVLVGLGFNIKMLEAYLVVPAFAVLYALAAPRPWRTRAATLALAGALLLVVSLSWSVAVDMTPASQRPYVGSSSTNSELNLAFGYNGIERLVGRFFGGHGGVGRAPDAARGTSTGADANRPGSASISNGSNSSSAPGAASFPRAPRARPTGAPFGFAAGETGAPSPLRLFNVPLGSQVSWLLPLALLGLLAADWGIRPRRMLAAGRAGIEAFAALPEERRTWRHTWRGALAMAGEAWSALRLTREQQAWVLWGMWLLTMAAFFSVAGFFHAYYMVMMAPSICALAGVGLVLLWHDYQRPGWRGWLLPLAILVTALAQASFLASVPGFAPWLRPLLLVLALATAGLLAALRYARQPNDALETTETLPKRLWSELAPRLRASAHRALPVAAIGALALLLGPTAWAAATVANPSNGMMPTAGPSQRGGFFAGMGGAIGGGDAQIDPKLVTYLETHQGHARFLVAMSSAMTAAPYVIATSKPIMALGGFSGSDPILTLPDLQHAVASDEVRYFLLAAPRSFSLTPEQIAELPPEIQEFLDESGGFRGGFRGYGGFGGGANASLTNWVTQHCATIPTSQWSAGNGAEGTQGGKPGYMGGREMGGAQQLYDCGNPHA